MESTPKATIEAAASAAVITPIIGAEVAPVPPREIGIVPDVIA